MELWPYILPPPEVNFTVLPDTNALRLDMESGTTRQRRRFTTDRLTLDVGWSFTQEELEIFVAFLALRLENGTAPFYMPLNLGGGEKLYRLRFPEGKYSTPYDVAGFWRVTAQLETVLLSDELGPLPTCPVSKTLRLYPSGLIPSTVPADPVAFLDVPPVVVVSLYSADFWTLTDSKNLCYRRASYGSTYYIGLVYNVTCDDGILHVQILLYSSPYTAELIFDGYGLYGEEISNTLADNGTNTVISGTVKVTI